MSRKREQWLLERKKGIGGSDIAAIVGLSKWQTPMDVWLDKTSKETNDETNLAMELGNYLEPLVIEKYKQATGNSVISNFNAIRDEKHEFARCNLDGFVLTQEGDKGVLEVKTAGNSREWGDPGTSDIPKHYYCQCQWNMRIAGVDWCDVPVLFFDYGRRIEVYSVDADAEFQQWLIEEAERFWQGVINNVMPAATTSRECEKAYPHHNVGSEAEADNDLCDAIEALREIKKQQKKLKETQDMLEAGIKLAMQNSEKLVDGSNVLATWKSSKTSRFDQSRFKKDHPELAKQFTTTTTSRRFLLK